MLKLVAIVAVIAAVAFQADSAATPFNNLVIQTTAGQVRGIEERTSLFGDRYFSWKGIPYAEPPTGHRRFRDPEPHRAWTGIRDANRHGASCAISGIIRDQIGQEDCLFLNVYTQNIIGSRPVMVWIHGGAFILGSGDDTMYGPDYFVTEDVVYVTMNYRLGILGFLSTGDQYAPGNYGLKDMVLALRWVKDNIANFGGDPNDITIFGESAGGVSVHMMLLSPMVEDGLFHKAIAQSGTGLSSWTINTNPAENAYALARQLGISYWDNEDLVDKLRNVAGDVLMNTTPGLLDMEISRGIVSEFTYAPVVEPAAYTGVKFLDRHPRELMEAGRMKDIPLIIGYCSDESLFMIREQILDGSVRDTINNNPSLIVPTTLWDVDPQSTLGRSIENELWTFYLNNHRLSLGNRMEWSQLNSDIHFIWGIHQTIQYHFRHVRSPIYYYRFSFDGSLNYLKRMLFLTSFPGAMHADDLGYLFNMPGLPLLPSNQANVVRRRMTRMWTDFAKYGTPTPFTDSLITTTWPRVTQNMEFMDIGENLVVGTYPARERMALFDRLYASVISQ